MADRRVALGLLAVLIAAGLGAVGARLVPRQPPADAPRARKPPVVTDAPPLQPFVLPAATPPAGAPSILLITMDTTRADHLGLYGYFRDTSPNLDQLAAESVVFERYTVPMSITLPSHMTVFTGTFPDEHGVTANVALGGKRFVPSEQLESFAEYADRLGYVTAAMVSSSPLKQYTGVNAGFQQFYEPAPDDEARNARETTDLALRWIEAAPDRPFFLWVHYFDPHWPYAPPGPWAERFRNAGVDKQKEWLTTRAAIPSGVQPLGVRAKIDRYDGEIAFMDQNIGRLFSGLRAAGAWDELVVVAVGDHGEGLMQHDYPSHGHVWTEQINPPLLLRVPGQPARRIQAPVSGVDVLPTLLGQLELPDEASILAQVSGQDVLAQERSAPVFFRTSEIQHDAATGEKFAKPITWGVGDAAWVLQRTDGADALYSRVDDPYELHDVAAEHPDVVARLGAELERQRAAQAARGQALGAGRTVQLTDAERAALEALGYVDGEPEQPKPEP